MTQIDAYVLLIDRTDDYEAPDPHGPFSSIEKAQKYAEAWRRQQGLPVEATPENNEEWTEQGWYFGIFACRNEFSAAGTERKLT